LETQPNGGPPNGVNLWPGRKELLRDNVFRRGVNVKGVAIKVRGDSLA